MQGKFREPRCGGCIAVSYDYSEYHLKVCICQHSGISDIYVTKMKVKKVSAIKKAIIVLLRSVISCN